MNQWALFGGLLEATALGGLVGLEREVRGKQAGLRTHVLVALGAALFMEVSKYAFSDIVVRSSVVLDPSRVAAQVASGIGFLGAGLIVVRGGSVQGLTTAAGVWMTAAVGLAAGAGLHLLALFATLLGLGTDFALRSFEARLAARRLEEGGDEGGPEP
ncbi:MAG: MgtC/SapB family protein [Clostridia bacterium]|nr:MgtC/SapB family protein [Clostridia bacterium]